eukprot:3974975-Amphidinium_carterae.1
MSQVMRALQVEEGQPRLLWSAHEGSAKAAKLVTAHRVGRLTVSVTRAGSAKEGLSVGVRHLGVLKDTLDALIAALNLGTTTKCKAVEASASH